MALRPLTAKLTISSSRYYHKMADHNLRIACLEPAATQVCLALGLASNIVGITHECKLDRIREALLETDNNTNKNKTNEPAEEIYILTKSGLDEGASQAEIHEAVDEEGKRRMQEEAAFDDDNDDRNDFPVSSLYPLVRSEWDKARPNLVFTQDLCAVCAPTPLDVERMTKASSSHHNDGKDQQSPTVVSLQPKTLAEVAETFITVANHCFPQEILESNSHPGKELKDVFWRDITTLQTAIEIHRSQALPKPRVLMLEWLVRHVFCKETTNVVCLSQLQYS